jgi:homoserine kinase type II
MTALDGRSNLQLPDDVDRVLAMARRYGFERVAALSQFESYGNENWLVELEDGWRAILRRYLHSSPERLQFQIDLLRRLRAGGFPVASVLLSTSGETTEIDPEGIRWLAFEHIEGREYNFSMEDAVQVARRLAEFHLLGADLASEAPPLVQRPSIRECWTNADSDLAGLQALFAGKGLDDELAYLEAWWRDVRSEWPLDRLDALPSGLVHGDLHGRNTAYVAGELAGIFDFDDVEAAPLAFDLAWSAHKFARTSRFDLTIRQAVVRAFLGAYEQVRPLTAEERASLPVMMAMTYPPNPRYYVYYRDHHGTNIENRLRREVGLMRLLRDEVRRVF